MTRERAEKQLLGNPECSCPTCDEARSVLQTGEQMGRFTQGPFHVESGSVWAEAADGSMLKLATVHAVLNHISMAERNSNARLFATAPRMYEALRNLAAVHECWCGPVGSRTCYRCEALVVLAEVEGK